jgi:hypothetical protein
VLRGTLEGMRDEEKQNSETRSQKEEAETTSTDFISFLLTPGF